MLQQNGMWEIISVPFYYGNTMEIFLNRADLLLHSVNSANLFKNGGMNWSQFEGRLLPVTIRVFRQCTKLAVLALLPTSYLHIFADFVFIYNI